MALAMAASYRSNGRQLGAGLLRACRGDAPHGVDDCTQLPDAGDARADVGEALRQAGAPGGVACAAATVPA